MLKILKPLSLVIFCTAIIYLILFFFVNAHAGEPEAAGFSGRIMAGGAFTTGKPSPDNASADKNRPGEFTEKSCIISLRRMC